MPIDYVHPRRQRKIILTADNPVTVIPGDITWSDFKSDLVWDEARQAFVWRPDQ